MDRRRKHHRAREAIRLLLGAKGFAVQPAVQAEGYDLLVNGSVHAAIRFASPGRYRHRVTVQGRSYSYDYRCWNFNFHRHGRWPLKNCDVFVCIAQHYYRRGQHAYFVISAQAVTGPTMSLHQGHRPYRGQYRGCINDWHVFSSLASGVGSDREERVCSR